MRGGGNCCRRDIRLECRRLSELDHKFEGADVTTASRKIAERLKPAAETIDVTLLRLAIDRSMEASRQHLPALRRGRTTLNGSRRQTATGRSRQ